MSFLDEFIGHMQNVVDDTISQTQSIGEDTLDAVLGEGSTKELEKQGLLDFGTGKASDIQGQMMGDMVGNIAKSFGVDPKIILIVGAAVAALVIVMVVAK